LPCSLAAPLGHGPVAVDPYADLDGVFRCVIQGDSDEPGVQIRLSGQEESRHLRMPGLRLSGCAGMKRSGQMLIPPVASRAIAAAAMRAVVSHPRMLAALPFT